jgi:prepilin-type N-terminal cleavage/methylation domain-containing protein
MGKAMKNSNRGFTLVETLISLALLATLFVLLGSLLNGMSRLSKVVEEKSVSGREADFCFEIMRKEAAEIIFDEKDPRYQINFGNNFFSYVTLRDELIARDSISRGAKRVEWRFLPYEKKLLRKVNQVTEYGTEIVDPSEEAFFGDLEEFKIYWRKDEIWEEATGVLQTVAGISAIKIRLLFSTDSINDKKQKTLETVIFVPEGAPFYAKK